VTEQPSNEEQPSSEPSSSSLIDEEHKQNGLSESNVSRTQTTKTQAKRSGMKSFLFILLLLVLSAVGGGGYFAWQFQQDYQTTVSSLQQALTSNQQNSQRVLEQVTLAQQEAQKSNQQSLQAMQQFRDEIQNVLTEQGQKIEAIKKTDRSDWLLAEVEYLLRLANQQAVLIRDTQGASVLLDNADSILQELGDSYFSEVRELIAEERVALSLHSKLDKEGLYFRIAALSEHIQKLPVVDLQNVTQQQEENNAIDETAVIKNQTFWQRMLQSLKAMFAKLGGVIKIQQHDSEIGPLISPQEQLYLKLNMRLMLEQAQFAVLQEKQAVFQDSLQKSATWLDQYFVMDKEQKLALIEELNSLQQLNIEAPLPDIAGSANKLKILLKARRQTASSGNN